ncbi:MAG: hypothetical protein SX243_25040, partial [Acidobacteriota bacterium]|nr:hypothetical protein [Acidobacteriota bacterium]
SATLPALGDQLEAELSPDLQQGYERSSAQMVVGSLDAPRGGTINPALEQRLAAYKAWKGRRGIQGRAATLDEFEFFRRGNAGKNGLQLYARKSGFGGRGLARARRLGVERAWADELALVQRGGGTREWSALERIELEATGRVSGYFGHHINSAARYPHLASNPANVRFVTWEEHFQLHGRNWANPTTGPLISR